MLGFSLEPAITKPQQRITMRCQGTLTNTQMVSWYKKQGEDGHPEILGFNNLISNSLYVDKLETADPEVIGDETIYVISLISANHEDSGYYGCGMMGEAIDKITWKELTIITPIRELKMFIIRSNETANMEMAVELKHGQDVTVNQGDEFYVRCMAIASNPPADMEITFGDHNLEDEFKTEEREYLDDPIISPASTLKMVLNDVNMTSIEPFVVEPEMSRTELTCKASVPSYDAKLITVRPILKSFPKVTCQDELAKIYETEVVLECEIECDPEPEHLYWYWTTHSGDNVTLHMDQNYDSNIVAKHSVNEEGKEIVKLIFGRVHTANAQAYHLVVDNGIGATNGTAVLNIDSTGESTQGVASATVSLALITMATVTAIFKLL